MSWLSSDAWIALPATALLAWALLACNRSVRAILPLDAPDVGRKHHGRATPLVGVAVVPMVAATLLASDRVVACVAVIACAAVGWMDDWTKERGVDFDWRIKACALLAASAALACAAASPFDEPLRFLAATVLAFVLVNATNFLDNTDGVCASLAATSLLLAGGASGPYSGAAFAALGFLVHNWPKARAFAGDAGAYALGICVASQCVERPLDVAGLAPFAVQFFDFAQVVCVRLLLGRKPWVGDRRHVTHWLLRLSVPRVAVAPLLLLAAFTIARAIGS